MLGAILVLSGCEGGSGNTLTTASQISPTPSTTPDPTPSPPPANAAEPLATATPTATPTATQATPPTSTATPAPITTPAPERHEEAPLLFDLLVADSDWGPVTDGDPQSATFRRGPGTGYVKVTWVTVPRLVMEGTGAVRTDDQGVVWRELRLGIDLTGWVEADRLAINHAAQTSFFDDPCATEGAATGPAPISGLSNASATDNPANHVAQIWHLIGPGCDRAHIALGTALDYGYGGDGPLASVVPDGTTVEAFGTWARITIPGLQFAPFDAAADQTWNLASVATVADRFGDRPVVIDIYAPRPSQFAARVLHDPARLLVDVIPSPRGDDGPPPPALQLYHSATTIVAWPGPLDAEDPFETDAPLTVRGYSRWFESGGMVELRHADGTPATATVAGPQVVDPGTGSRWGITATAWYEAWGSFEFIIDDAEPGEYRLLVGEYFQEPEYSFEGVVIPLRFPSPAAPDSEPAG